MATILRTTAAALPWLAIIAAAAAAGWTLGGLTAAIIAA